MLWKISSLHSADNLLSCFILCKTNNT